MIKRRTPLKRTPLKRKAPIKRTAVRLARSPLKRTTKPIARQRIRVTPKARARKAAERPVIDRVRGVVFVRASNRCERCGLSGTDANPLQLHETHSRAQTRGCPPEARFDERWCVCVCAKCHDLCTRNVVTVLFQDVTRGAEGRKLFVTLSSVADDDRVRYWFTARQVWAAATGRKAA